METKGKGGVYGACFWRAGVFFKPVWFANIVGLWLALIILNLLFLGSYYDIAARDLGLCLSAFALGKLQKSIADCLILAELVD